MNSFFTFKKSKKINFLADFNLIFPKVNFSQLIPQLFFLLFLKVVLPSFAHRAGIFKEN
jgi:hypothetical protein